MRGADVAVWRVPLDATRAPDARAVAGLSEAERTRAGLFVTEALRNRWLGAHVALRAILADALGVAPSTIGYGVADAGKPFVAVPERHDIEFNLSDSGDVALVAVSRCGPVGVDVEQWHPHRDRLPLADAFFAEEEREALRILPPDERHAAFYRVWARKEAFIKATGLGLAFGLSRFAVSIAADTPQLLRIDDDPRLRGRWQLMDVPVPAGHAGALALPEGAHHVAWGSWVP